MSILTNYKPYITEKEEETQGKKDLFIAQNIASAKVLEEVSTKPSVNVNSYTNVSPGFILIWEPSITNGVIEIPYRDIYKKIVKDREKSDFEAMYRFVGKDLLEFKKADWELLKRNQILTHLTISSGRYLLLERFEIPRSLVVAQRITQASKFYSVINENFPRFLMTLRVVIFANLHKAIIEFFNTIIELISKNYPGRFYAYDILGNEQIDILKSFIFGKDKINRRHYRLLPLNINYSRSASENTTMNIEISGIVLEINGQYSL
ncbi:MAG: hypothetical protein QXX30_00010 [Candidatus Aenigmatarchaeota archaeon]